MTPKTKKKTMLSAVQPTNLLTLGNYLGAIRNWVKLQEEFECIFFAVDLHSITAQKSSANLKQQTYQLLATYLAAGIKPDEATLFVQSQVSAHAELAWVFNCFTWMGELNRMTQFKDKSTKQKNISVGLFAYPTLMAADILLYQADLIPVGEDQKQHVELTRDIALRMNRLYGDDLFKIPEPYIPPVGARIMSLQNPLVKMSKSDPDPNSAIFLSDSNDQILKKVKRAVTDSGSEIVYQDDRPGLKNLIQIQSALSGKPAQEIVASYAGKQYGHLKVETGEMIIGTLGPIRDEIQRILNNLDYLDAVCLKGAAKAREMASKTLEKVYDRVGFLKPQSSSFQSSSLPPQ